ncbi:hypothetical protein BDW22DRAFT_1357085 [Trametopsis cervina]|nr:hypothetical protein BDW22DRAFT_1357085 [Trametopsis cervina]
MEERKRSDYIILVMGPTGAGKTTFINLASGSDLRVGNSLQSCTDEIQFSRRFQVKGKEGERTRWVVLVDSPGFDDTQKTESDILEKICTFLGSEYSQQRLLTGILYLHRITDNRMTGSSVRNLQAYQALCGPNALKNSIVVTTMWSRADPAKGEQYEQELKSKDKFFKPALDHGAKFIRHLDTQQSAHDIIREFDFDEPVALRIQEELVDEQKKVFETAAGEALLQEIAKAEQKHLQEMRDLEKELAEARRQAEVEAQKEIEEEYARVDNNRKLLEAEKAKLFALQLEFEALRQHPESDDDDLSTRPSSPTSQPTPTGRVEVSIGADDMNNDTNEADHEEPLRNQENRDDESGNVKPKAKKSLLKRLLDCLESTWKRFLSLFKLSGSSKKRLADK